MECNAMGGDGMSCCDGEQLPRSRDRQCSAVQCSAVQYSTVRCSVVQCSATRCNAMQCSAVQNAEFRTQCGMQCGMQRSAVQCRMQCNAMRCGAMQLMEWNGMHVMYSCNLVRVAGEHDNHEVTALRITIHYITYSMTSPPSRPGSRRARPRGRRGGPRRA